MEDNKLREELLSVVHLCACQAMDTDNLERVEELEETTVTELLKVFHQYALSQRIDGLDNLIDEVDERLPWPKDVFGEVPSDDWSDIDDWLRENKGYAIDTLSATLMRRGWANFNRELKSSLKEEGEK